MNTDTAAWQNLAVNGGVPVRTEPIWTWPIIDEDTRNAVLAVLESRRLTQFSSSKVTEFEHAFAKFYGTRHAIAVNSGTAALHVALESVGVQEGDEVIVPPFTFVASASAILHARAVPVFADIDPQTYCIDPADIERKITDKTKAIVAVHIFGQPAEMDPINEIARANGLAVVEDAAQAHDSRYNGKLAGTIGDAGCFSLYDSKNITTGEGGMIVTDSDEIAEICRLVRHHGQSGTYDYVRLGYNYRMTAMEAALGIMQLGHLKSFNEVRRNHAAYYDRALADLPITLPYRRPDTDFTTHVYTVLLPETLADRRDDVLSALRAENVYVSVCYPVPLYITQLFRDLPYDYPQGLCPVAEQVAARCITLPVHHAMTSDEARDIVTAMHKVIPAFIARDQ
ncbi:MAG: DegT/DnrJ/EryC1/StrS family aminotransferase [Candidatus Hydrogenedentes bacterium]|nr:DegT/DnrJ/EryC1/StrS family aminotransferase [Candidatus Hydrogenedentota bacterium]